MPKPSCAAAERWRCAVRNNSPTNLVHAALLVAGTLGLGACDWFTDFKQQPSVHTWGVFSADSAELKGFRGQPAGSVGTNGTLVSIYQVSHGEAGDGNSVMKQLNPMYGFPPSLLTDQAKARSDGYIWGMMRNGRGLMPPYNRIEEADRWDVVNYLRGLQGKFPVVAAPVGRPGETGDKLPGATRQRETTARGTRSR